MRQKADLTADSESSAVSDPHQVQPDAQKPSQPGMASSLRKLQRSHGNRFVQRLLKPGTLQRTAADQQEPEGVPHAVHDVLRSPGQPLDSSTQEFMSSRFGEDFSHVQVHTDSKAAASADAVNATAYTVGSDVVFGAGQYSPGTAEGKRVLAHELAHVSQQGGEAGSVQTLSLGPVNSPEESEADAVADAVVSNQTVPEVSGDHADPTVRRKVSGGIVGGILGAGAGALIGGLLGGALGAVAGGLIGAVAGLALGDVATSNKRNMTEPEKAEAGIVFGSSLNFEEVQLAEAPIMSVGGFARTLPNMIYLPPGTLSDPLSVYMPLLIHELTHVWQYQHGVTVTTTLFHALFSTYDYGDEAGLVAAKSQGKKLKDFNTEQQGDICRDYYNIKKGLKTPINGTTAWDPYIAEVQGTEAGADITGAAGDRFTEIV